MFPQDGIRGRTGTRRRGPVEGGLRFRCIVCDRILAKRSALRHFTQGSTHGFAPAYVKPWVVVADGCHIGNGRPEHVRLTELLATDNEEESNDEQEVNTDETVAYVNSAVLDASFGTEREVHTVRDSDEELRSIARRCPMPKSWSTPRAVRRRTRAKTPPRLQYRRDTCVVFLAVGRP